MRQKRKKEDLGQTEVADANRVSGKPQKRKRSRNNSSLVLQLGQGQVKSEAEVSRLDWSPLLFS